jgi:hypothetical protein
MLQSFAGFVTYLLLAIYCSMGSMDSGSVLIEFGNCVTKFSMRLGVLNLMWVI